MAKAYWIVCYHSIKSQDAFQAYAKLAAHEAAGYQEALKQLTGDAVKRDMRIVEGVG